MSRSKWHNQLRLDFEKGGTWMKLPAEAREVCTKLLSHLFRGVIAADAKDWKESSDEQREDPRVTS